MTMSPLPSSSTLLRLIAEPFSGVTRGRALAALDAANKTLANRFRTAEFLDALVQIPAPATTTVQHPRDAARRNPRSAGPLQPSEIAWLQRIPTDPAAVTFEEATDLARLAASLSRVSDPADARLVQAAWRPIAEHHDERVAQAALRNASMPLPQIPASALGAIAEAIQAESAGGLPDDVIMSRAHDLLREALDKRGATRQKAIDDAKAKLEDLTRVSAERTRLTA